MQANFHASIQLSLNGLGIEAEAVIRQGLEQVAWAVQVLSMDNSDKVRSIKPNSFPLSSKE